MSKIANKIDLGFDAKVSGMSQVDQLYKKLKEIEKMKQVDFKVGGGTGFKRIEDQQKAHSMALLEEQKRRARTSEAEAKKQVGRRESLEKIKLNIIKNNLKKMYMAEHDLLKQKDSLNAQEVKDFKKKVDETMAIQQGARAEFTQDISQLMALRQFGNYIKGQTSEFEKFEDALYQTGIVAGRSSVEINSMRQEVLDLGLNIPRTTQEILENITAVQRTGRSYEEAGQIISKSAKLAVSSGESIALSTDVINKALIAFNINVSETSKVMDIFHTASANMPVDLQKLSDGMKNSASSMRNFIESTDKSGEALEDYKMRLLAMNTALISGQVAMGRQASSSGMSIRTLGTKLTVLEKSAKRMFSAQMELNDVMIKNDKIVRDGSGGIRLTSEALMELSQRDLPRAIELLSELYKTGEITMDTLSKMFTGKMFALHTRNGMSKVA